MTNINNIPNNLNNYKYIVATKVNDELWFWGEYKERNKAYEVASKIGDGVVVENDYPNHIDNSPIDSRMNLIYNSLERKYREAKKGTFTKQLLELDMMFLDKMLAE